MVDKLLERIGSAYPLVERDAGAYKSLKANGMRFEVRAYDAKGLGAVSVMRASGFFGLMKMDTLIVNPTCIDMPLLSYDRVHAMGNDTLIFELYNTLVQASPLHQVNKVKAAHAALPDHDLGSHWYDEIKLTESVSKKGKKKETPAFDEMTCAYMDAFLADCTVAEPCDAAAKREKASVYVEGLLIHGGPSTDVFKKSIGAEKTAELFRRVLFATEA